jgi:hypothetical protein
MPTGSGQTLPPARSREDEEPQLAIEDVNVENVGEGGPRGEPMRGVIRLERKRVADESVIVQVGKVKLRLFLVLDQHATLPEEFHLLLAGESRLRERLLHVQKTTRRFEDTPGRGA